MEDISILGSLSSNYVKVWTWRSLNSKVKIFCMFPSIYLYFLSNEVLKQENTEHSPGGVLAYK